MRDVDGTERERSLVEDERNSDALDHLLDDPQRSETLEICAQDQTRTELIQKVFIGAPDGYVASIKVAQ